MGSPVLPLDSFREAAVELRRPFEVRALKWKVQSNLGGGKDKQPTGGLIVCYIDRGLAIDRLNMVIPHLWTPTFTALDGGHMLCRITVAGEPPVVREDVGEGGTYKARYSDALKRTAVHLGVGVSLTRVPKSRLWVKDKALRAWKGANDKWHLDLEQKGLDYLRTRYENWLQEVGVGAFGEPFMHGDLGDAQGDDEVADDAIVDDHGAVDLYISLSEAGLTLRQQVGLLNTVGASLKGGASSGDIEASVKSLTEDQAVELDGLIAQRMGVVAQRLGR